jgi:hypothetical protein
METFVVRIFVPADGAKLEIAGTVRHVASGAEQSFRGRRGLVAAVVEGLLHPTTEHEEAEPCRTEEHSD